MARAVADELTIPTNIREPNFVETLDDSGAAQVQRMLPGLTIIHWSDEYGALPDDSLFLDLAIQQGTSADTAFFRLRAATADAWGTPAWVQPMTDYSGCTRFGSGALVSAWRGWSRYKGRYPGRYASSVTGTLKDIERTLIEDDCVCGDKEDLIRELRLFVKTFPRSSLAPRVRTRLDVVTREAVRIRYHCSPG